MDELTRHWNCLSLSEREGDDLCLTRNRCTTEHLIAALFLTQRALNMEAVARTFKPLWRVDSGFTVSNEGAHKVVFSFENSEDVDRILSGEPWSFDKSLVILQRYNRLTSLDDLTFDKVSFWVQVHNIPIGYRTKSVAEDICEAIGIVDRSTEAAECECGTYVRVRVTLDVYQPLCRGRIIKVKGGEKVWVNFRYERLPNICYWCGCFDHSDKDCDIWIESKGSLQTNSQQFGSWLRANQMGPSKRNVIRVSGFYEDRPENISTRRRREGKNFPTPEKTSETGNQPEKGNSDMEADFAEIPNTEAGGSMSQHGKSNPSLLEREIMGDYFSQKIKEIDKDLGIHDNSINSAQVKNITPNKENSPLFDLEHLRNNLAEKQSLHRDQELTQKLHDGCVAPLHKITNVPKAPALNEVPLTAKWKRYSRVAKTNDTPATKDEVPGSKRPINIFTDQSELPNKKLMVSCFDKENTPVMAEAGSQPRQAQ